MSGVHTFKLVRKDDGNASKGDQFTDGEIVRMWEAWAAVQTDKWCMLNLIPYFAWFAGC